MSINFVGLLWYAKVNGVPNDDVVDTLAKYHHIWMLPHNDCLNEQGEFDIQFTLDLNERIRHRDTGTKLGAYLGGVTGYRQIDPSYTWVTDDDLFHSLTGEPLIWHDDVGWPSGEHFTFKMPNLLSNSIADRLVSRWVQFAHDNKLDSLFFDSYEFQFWADVIKNTYPYGWFGLPNGCREGPMQYAEWWAGALATFTRKLRYELERDGKELHVNGLYPQMYHPIEGFGLVNNADYVSGLYDEAAHVMYESLDIFVGTLSVFNAVVDKRRKACMSVSPGLWYYTNNNTDQVSTPNMFRFFLTSYLLIEEPPYTSFSYNPYVPYRGWAGWDANGGGATPYAFWSPELEMPFGQSLQKYVIGNPVTVAWRPFTSGIAVVNPTNTIQFFRAAGRYRIWNEGPVLDWAEGYYVPPKTGWFLFSA